MKSSFDQIEFSRDAELIEEEHIYKQPILNVILSALLQSSFLGSERNRPRLHNEDIVKLAAHRLPERVVIRVIELYESDFDTSGTALSNLQECGIGNTVIEAMLSKTFNAIVHPMLNRSRLLQAG